MKKFMLLISCLAVAVLVATSAHAVLTEVEVPMYAAGDMDTSVGPHGQDGGRVWRTWNGVWDATGGIGGSGALATLSNAGTWALEPVLASDGVTKLVLEQDKEYKIHISVKVDDTEQVAGVVWFTGSVDWSGGAGGSGTAADAYLYSVTGPIGWTEHTLTVTPTVDVEFSGNGIYALEHRGGSGTAWVDNFSITTMEDILTLEERVAALEGAIDDFVGGGGV